MAAITNFTRIGDKRPSGRYFEQTYSIVVASSAASDEWIATGFGRIIAVVGHAVQGATDRGVNFVINGQGTAATAGDNLGDLGIEATGAATVQVTVLGR